MKKTILAALALASIAGVTGAQAQSTPDIYLAIRQQTVDASHQFTYVLDLGSSASVLSPIDSASPLNFNTLASFTSLALATDLSNQFGANWATTTKMYLWGGNSSAIVVGSGFGTSFGVQHAENLTGMQTSLNDLAANSYRTSLWSPSPALQVSNAWLSADGETGAFDNYIYGGTPGIFNGQGVANFVSLQGGELSVATSDNLAINVLTASGSTKTGYITLGADGSVTAVPEPSTYALIGIGSLLLIVAYRRKVSSQS